MNQHSFKYEYGIGDVVYINTQGGKCLTVVDVCYSLRKGLEYLTIDETGMREYYAPVEISQTKQIEL